MFKGQPPSNYNQKVTSGISFWGSIGTRGGRAQWPTIVSSHPEQTPPKERQTVIDGFFEPITGKDDQHQRFDEKESQYFADVSMPLIDDQITKAFENDADMYQHEPIHQAVPTSPMPLARSTCEVQALPKAQIVPLIHQAENRSLKKLEPRSWSTPSDLSKICAGGIRLRSIQFVCTIDHVINSFATDLIKEGSRTALLEIVGTLVSPLSYHNYCWDFEVRDPTAQDFARKFSTQSKPLTNQITPSSNTLQCRMYDVEKSTNHDTLEGDEILRIIGIVEQKGDIVAPRMQCVAMRRASLDEVKFTTQGYYRGLSSPSNL